MSDFHDDDAITTANMQRRMDAAWGALQAFIGSLSDVQLSGPTDANGWTVKDHVVHLAAWEDSLVALLNGQSRAAALGVDQATWERGADAVNAVVQARERHQTPDEARETLRRSHERLMSRLLQLTDEDLVRPHRDFDPTSSKGEPIIYWIDGNSFGHYLEQLEWMRAIVEPGAGQEQEKA